LNIKLYRDTKKKKKNSMVKEAKVADHWGGELEEKNL
jgi:hypothetical protein